MSQSPAKKTKQPAKTPADDRSVPDDLPTASSMRSNATALISTPAPKRHDQPDHAQPDAEEQRDIAPITSDDAARVPRPKDAAI